MTVLTGPHVSVLPEDSLRRSAGADYAVLREFDYVLRDLAAAVENSRDPSDLPGLAFLRDGRYVENKPAPLIENLDELPFSIQVVEKHLIYYGGELRVELV
jgi:radical SAM superfamily enzyme YgiQ (UPF0313 family)